jgi:hypothetical protein
MLKKFARAGALLGAAVVAATAALPALAAPPPDVFKDSRGNVYIHGTLATTLNGQSSPRIGTNQPLTRSIRAGYCGEVRISTSSSQPDIGTSWTIGGTTRQLTSLPSITSREMLPRCSGNAFSPALTSAMTTAGGFVDNTGNVPRVYLTGYTAGVSQPVSFGGVTASRSANANDCGFFRLTNTESNPLPSQLTINGTNYTVASLTVADPPLCQRGANGTSYVRYNPMSW